jgi:hypothetical protein
MLLAVDPDQDSIDVARIAIATALSLRSSDIARAELDAPQSVGFAADRNTMLGENIINIAMAAIEAIVEPDCVRNDVWWKAMAFVCFHRPILTSLANKIGRTNQFDLGGNLVSAQRTRHLSVRAFT